MNILMVLEKDFPPDIRVEHEVLALHSAGHQIIVACFTRSGRPYRSYWNKAIIYRKKLSTFRAKTSTGCLKFPFYFDFWRPFLMDVYSHHPVDAVHVHDLPLAQLGLELQQIDGVTFVLDLHENWPALLKISPHLRNILGQMLYSDAQWRAYEQRMTAAADDIIVVVEENKKRLRQFVADDSKIHVVSNTPDLAELNTMPSPRSADAQRMVLFYGGDITELRGLQHLLAALQKLRHARMVLRIVGDGRYLKTLKKLAARYGVTDRIVFYGYRPLAEMVALMRASHVLVIPHIKSELTDTTVPHKLFQYMLTDKPILASDCAPLARIINETRSGFIYPHDDIEALVRHITMLYQGWERSDPFTTTGSRYVYRHYNWSVDQQTLLRIYA